MMATLYHQLDIFTRGYLVYSMAVTAWYQSKVTTCLLSVAQKGLQKPYL